MATRHIIFVESCQTGGAKPKTGVQLSPGTPTLQLTACNQQNLKKHSEVPPLKRSGYFRTLICRRLRENLQNSSVLQCEVAYWPALAVGSAVQLACHGEVKWHKFHMGGQGPYRQPHCTGPN